MILKQPVRPFNVHVCPLMGTRTTQSDGGVVEDDEEEVNPKLVVLGEPIVGVDRVVFDEETGPGAIPARPLQTPRSMTTAQRAIHDLTHLP